MLVMMYANTRSTANHVTIAMPVLFLVFCAESGGQQHGSLLQISNESVELEELREMKSDVERREKAQAAVLERQAKRLEELETLYKVNLVPDAYSLSTC